MSLLKNNIQLFVLLSIFAFLFFWQKFAWVSLFLIPIFLAFFLEFFYFLRLRKNIIKEATMIKDSLIYRVSAGDFYIYSLSFFMALFALASLFLNLISFEKQDGFFLFVLLPLFLFFFKQKLQLQFLDNAYNDFRIIILSSLILALLYAIFNGVVNPIQSFNLEDFNQSIIHYKNSKFFVFDLISQILTLINALKEYFLYSLGLFWFRVLNFIFDFINFFIFCSFVAYLYNFAFKAKKKTYVFVFSFFITLASFFIVEDKNQNPKAYQKELVLMMNNLSFLKEQNLSMLQNDKDRLVKNLKQVQELLDKNAFEIGIWWFSKEKEELQKSLNESLQ
ncbi:hypothetical protein EAG64_04535 [Campylobacter coli]|nr:hypothetical protein [Campylobacter coli]EAL2060201.1 hypothetical protein [Campylobacter coli]